MMHIRNNFVTFEVNQGLTGKCKLVKLCATGTKSYNYNSLSFSNFSPIPKDERYMTCGWTGSAARFSEKYPLLIAETCFHIHFYE